MSTERVAIHRPHERRDAVSVSYLDAERFWIDVEVPLDGSAPRASRRAERVPRAEATPLPPPAHREPPAWLDALRGLEIVSSTGTIAATDDGWLTVCRRDERLECTPPAAIEPLRRERVVLTDVLHMFGEVCSVGFQWTLVGEQGDESGALQAFTAETGQGDLFVRAAESLTLLATVVTAMDRRAPSSDERGAFDVVEMESFDSDLTTETCLQAGRPTGVRRRESAGGDERQLGAIAFARAPDELPATGVSDPLAIGMEGAWTVLPEGGLRRRARRCPEY